MITSCAATGTNIQALLSQAEQAGQLAPSIPGSSIDEARLQSAAANPPLCIADYTEALRDFPDLVKAYSGRGSCYVNGGGNAPAAVHDYNRAITLAPNTSELYLRRAAAQGLGEIGTNARRAAPLIRPLLEDGDEDVRHAAENALRKIEAN